MEQNSVKTAPQPPSAFMPRRCACAPGLSAPGPAQCEVCQNLLRSVLGPILIGSNNTSCLGSRDIYSSSRIGGKRQPLHAPLHASVYTHRRGIGPGSEKASMMFAGKVVLVTGSTTGIGEACARVFAESGAKVMVSGRQAQRGGAVVEAIRAAGGSAQFAAADLREAGACERLVGDTVERWGGLDILVNNAGILYSANALNTSDEQWLDTMAVNVNALFYLSRAAVRLMKAAGKGAIVNVASEWGLNGEANHVAYCASKGAVIQITRCMALDHARDNIRINSVCPGEIHTRMVDEILAGRGGDPANNLRDLAAGIPMRRLAHPDEVARCVQFLASDLASYVTGTNLSVDGGNDATAGPYP